MYAGEPDTSKKVFQYTGCSPANEWVSQKIEMSFALFAVSLYSGH